MADMAYVEKSAEDLFSTLFPDTAAEDKRLLLVDDLPSVPMRRLDLTKFKVINRGEFPIRNCFVWFPAYLSQHLRPTITFEVIGSLEDCNFVFFRVPDKRAKLVWSLWGKNHTTVSFSKRRMNLYARISNRDCTLAIGDAVFIGGGRLAMNRTTVKIGACGLWSDGILLQGTDSHGIVDLDTMEIINDQSQFITLQRRVWLGRGATVMKNVTVGEGSIAATGALVVKSVPPACAVGGSPAKVVKERVSWTHRQDHIPAFDQRELMKLRSSLE